MLREESGIEKRIPIDYKKLLAGDPSQENHLPEAPATPCWCRRPERWLKQPCNPPEPSPASHWRSSSWRCSRRRRRRQKDDSRVPSVTFGGGYSDNVEFVGADETSDTIYRLSVDLPVTRQLKNGTFSFRYSPSYEDHRDQDDLDRDEHSHGVGARLDVSRLDARLVRTFLAFPGSGEFPEHRRPRQSRWPAGPTVTRWTWSSNTAARADAGR